MRELSWAQAMALALGEALAADERIVVFSPGLLGISGNAAAADFDRLRARFPDRFVEPPIAELGVAGLAAGAAMNGLRPMMDISTGSFAFEAFAAIANEAAVAYYTSDRRTRVPVLFHLYSGIRGAGASQHSQAPHALFWQTPGIQIVMPACPSDARGLLAQALLHSQNPTLYVNHYQMLDVTGPVPEEPETIPFGRAAVRRAGSDVTVVACGVMVPRALAAADRLSVEGVSVEVIDPRTLVPLDIETVLASVRKTRRLVTADETPRSCGAAGELLARICECVGPDLKAPPRRVSTPDVPIPFSEPLERRVTPTADALARAVRDTMEDRRRGRD